MSLHCFTIPALQPEPAQSELNAFLASGKAPLPADFQAAVAAGRTLPGQPVGQGPTDVA